MADLAQLIVPAGIGLLAGIVGSLVAPWVHWAIERRRQQLASRRNFIAEARASVEAATDRDAFRESAVYSRLRPYLEQKTIDFVEYEGTTIQGAGRGAGANNFKPKVLDEIRCLEMQWKLL